MTAGRNHPNQSLPVSPHAVDATRASIALTSSPRNCLPMLTPAWIAYSPIATRSIWGSCASAPAVRYPKPP